MVKINARLFVKKKYSSLRLMDTETLFCFQFLDEVTWAEMYSHDLPKMVYALELVLVRHTEAAHAFV
jgi:hypothetical protein